ncbi:MAG TPA: response regulator [Chitinophagaceae bacterium]|nr:response regulator [Chitinophagaceae bacterium]
MPTILVADDDEGIRDIFQILLGNEGYVLDIKSNGEDLLADNFSLPDLFLIDKQLSGISGLDVCRHLKSMPHTRDIPLIMVSASPDIATLSKEAGADEYIEKPFDINYLLRMIKEHLQKQQVSGIVT